jgi:hypothetical protein
VFYSVARGRLGTAAQQRAAERATQSQSEVDRNGVIAASVLAPIAALLAIGVFYIVRRERAGQPLFTPLMQEETRAAVKRVDAFGVAVREAFDLD